MLIENVSAKNEAIEKLIYKYVKLYTELHQIKPINWWENFIQFSPILISAIALWQAALLFKKTKGKEYKIKKSEICGEIYGSILEMKVITQRDSYYRILYDAYSMAYQIKKREEEEYQGQDFRTSPDDEDYGSATYLNFRDEANKSMMNNFSVYTNTKKVFANCIGQYRFYLENANKKMELDLLAEPIQKMQIVFYYDDFKKLKTVSEIETTKDRIIGSYVTDLQHRYTLAITALQKFIDDNEKDLKL